jgi:hypothetical protein
MLPESTYWPGGKLQQDQGVLIYNVNHLKVLIIFFRIYFNVFPYVQVKNGSMDAAILATKLLSSKSKKPINFGEYDFITDAINLQKLFAFAQEAGDGMLFSRILILQNLQQQKETLSFF